eukprot:Em0004g1502a
MLSIEVDVFTTNTTGGGVQLLLLAGIIGITNCTFQNNSAINGGAVFSWVGVLSEIHDMELNGKAEAEPFGHLILQGVMVKDNLCSCNDYDELKGGAIYFNGMKVDIFGSTFTGSQFSSNSPLGAIQGTNGFLNLHAILTCAMPQISIMEKLSHILAELQKAQWIGTVCGTMEYQIYGPQMASLKLLLSNYPSNTPTVVEVTLLPCEPGFTLISNSSTGVMECSCSELFTSFRVVCDASDGTVTRNKPNWIGMYNSTHPALASSCPMDYCNSAIDKVSLARPGDLCNGGRTGIICGSCHGNHSVVFGSSQCTICSNMWLITLVMFAVLGALLVAALFFRNFTVTQGTLYGLIFYANIIQINSSIFFHQAIPSLQMIVSFINLDLGIPMCFYNGMDDADKAGLQFVFPAYLLILTLTVIVICHYCLQRSPNTSTSSCLYRFPIIIGERAVGVLCTLIYLSYYKLLRTVIDIFTYSTVHLPSGDMNVWFYDGNVEYLQGKHAALFIIAVVTCTLFLLPYTFALTFIPIIEQYSEHNRLFNYLHKLANKFKPANDAHYAPYKGEWRWWLGARLWLVVVMYSLNPVYSSDNPSLLLSIQATLVMLFMLVQANIQPFGQPLQKMDKCNRHTSAYNKLYNCLDLMYLLNYTALAMSMSYILGKSSNEAQISVSVSVGLYVAMLLVTVLYHFIVAILKAVVVCDGIFQTGCRNHTIRSTKDSIQATDE